MPTPTGKLEPYLLNRFFKNYGYLFLNFFNVIANICCFISFKEKIGAYAPFAYLKLVAAAIDAIEFRSFM